MSRSGSKSCRSRYRIMHIVYLCYSMISRHPYISSDTPKDDPYIPLSLTLRLILRSIPLWSISDGRVRVGRSESARERTPSAPAGQSDDFRHRAIVEVKRYIASGLECLEHLSTDQRAETSRPPRSSPRPPAHSPSAPETAPPPPVPAPHSSSSCSPQQARSRNSARCSSLSNCCAESARRAS